MHHEKPASCFICVSPKDIPYLFEYALISCLEKIDFINEINILTPDQSLVKKKLSELNVGNKIPINIISDSKLLSKKELKLCGWSRQQIIKLRSYKLSGNKDVLSVGADTIILKKIKLSQFYNPKTLVVNYRRHDVSNKHYLFEIERCKNICNLFGLASSGKQEIMRDYIFDVFLFKNEVLRELNGYLSKKFGDNYFLKIFPRFVNGYEDMIKIGEWTMYTIFAIKILKLKYKLQNGTKIVRQIHSHEELDIYDYNDRAAHFVRKDFNINLIFSNIRKYMAYYENNDY